MIIAEWSLTGEYVKILAIKRVKSGRGRISQRWLLTREFLKRYSIRLRNKTVTLFFFYKNIFYKNIEAEICEILRIF